MLPLVTKKNLEDRVTVAAVYRYSQNGNDDLISGPQGAIPQSISKARSAALQVFTPESWDAMTPEVLPGEALYHIVNDALDILSSGSARPVEIQTKADEATKWRSYLAGGAVHCFDDILVRRSAATGSASLRAGAPEQNKFDGNNPHNPLRRNLWPS